MGGKSSATQDTQQSQSAQFDPWAPTHDTLNGILGGINSQVGSYNANPAETGALNTIMQNAQSVPNYGPQAQSFANDLMTGGPDRTGLVNDAYSNFQKQMNPYANGQNLDPTLAPGMQGVLDTIRSDVSNSVNGMFAGAGRDMSGMHQQSLARGIAQGEAAPLLAQYNQNVQNQMAAANGLYNAGGQTAGLLSNLTQQSYANRAQGLDAGINGVPAAMNAGANGILGASAQARNLPLQNLGMLSALTVPIAGLGGSSTGKSTGHSEGTQQMSGAQQFATIAGGMGNLAKFWG